MPMMLESLTTALWVLVSHVPMQSVDMASIALYLPLRDFVDFIVSGVIVPARDGEQFNSTMLLGYFQQW